jgi:peptidoglycan/LPS O-acetylase OafA/YrhL
VRDWNAQLPTRDSNAWLASKGGTASDRWPRSILWIAVAAVALAVRRPRGSAPILLLMGVGGLVLCVHALSQAPQNEFALPFVPVWIVAALVGLLAPRKADGERP